MCASNRHTAQRGFTRTGRISFPFPISVRMFGNGLIRIQQSTRFDPSRDLLRLESLWRAYSRFDQATTGRAFSRTYPIYLRYGRSDAANYSSTETPANPFLFLEITLLHGRQDFISRSKGLRDLLIDSVTEFDGQKWRVLRDVTIFLHS
jgi:hypothetical protein